MEPAGRTQPAAILSLVNEQRLPGQPCATEADLEADLSVPGATLTVLVDPQLRGAACRIPRHDGSCICWAYAGEDRAALRATIEQACGAQGSGCRLAFRQPAAVNWGVPGLPAARRPETHRALLELGFRARRRWLYLTGRPARRPPHVADTVRETGRGCWLLEVCHDDQPVAEARVELRPPDKAIVRWIGVAEAFRGRGLGRALFDQATNVLGAQGARDVVLFVVTDGAGACDHRPALRLYARAGFEVTDHLYAYERDPGGL
jgi:ribosomal protein S18 acetylase RimI-like enzyme